MFNRIITIDASLPPPLQSSSSPESTESSESSEENLTRRTHRTPGVYTREACRKSHLHPKGSQPSTPQRSYSADNIMLSPRSNASTASYEDVLEDMEVRLQVAKQNVNESKAVLSDVVKESKVAKKVVVQLNSAIKALRNVNK
jgi:hypothetical protein